MSDRSSEKNRGGGGGGGGGQSERKEEKEQKGRKLEGLPVGTSPYTQYKDLEDYKQKGYGTEGHLQPEPGRGAASSVDAPTEAGVEASRAAQVSSTEVINRHGVP